MIAILMEKRISKIFNYPIKIKLFNIIDYYNKFDSNNISQYVDVFLNLYENDQRALAKGI